MVEGAATNEQPVPPSLVELRRRRRRRLFALWVSVFFLLGVQAALALHLRRRARPAVPTVATAPASRPTVRPDLRQQASTPASTPATRASAAPDAGPAMAVKGEHRRKRGKRKRSGVDRRKQLPRPAIAKAQPLPTIKGPVNDVTVPAALSGDAGKGERLFRMGCGLCHDQGGKPVSPGRYSAKQWRTFFARGVHGQYQKLGAHFTRAELMDIKAYLISAAGGR